MDIYNNFIDELIYSGSCRERSAAEIIDFLQQRCTAQEAIIEEQKKALDSIVRCGNCIHWDCKVDNNGAPFHFGYCWEHGCEFWDNDFCSDGKDKDDCN